MNDNLVWVVSRWTWGQGGDDIWDILGVCSTSEKAYELAQPHVDGREEIRVMAYPLDREVQPA